MAQGNSYEEARKKRLEDNKRRLEESGVLNMANSLKDVIKKDKKYQARVKSKDINPVSVRRSSRPRNQVTYSEVIGWKKCKTSYIATRVATKAERSDALERAMSFQSGLLSRNPSFVTSMFLSQVAGRFLLNLPLELCNNYFPNEAKVRIMLEDEEGSLYETHYSRRSRHSGLSSGWRAFSKDHRLDVGDALVLELTEPTRFKVHIFKVSNDIGEVKVNEPEKARESKICQESGC
ncbi:hypothetical protein MKX01_012883 [Papaver californicum]|nr:hypothetical protein MKX01_012883 [Papaver californicum]